MKKYLKLKTNSLVGLAGRKKDNKIDWENIGTSVTAINLDSNFIAKELDGEINYILPVMDETKALEFKLKAEKQGIEVELVEEEAAKTHKEDFEKVKAKKGYLLDDATRIMLVERMLQDFGYIDIEGKEITKSAISKDK